MREVQGSQPVGVRSRETPGSRVAHLPCVGESPGMERREVSPSGGAGDWSGPQHKASTISWAVTWAALGWPVKAV